MFVLVNKVMSSVLMLGSNIARFVHVLFGTYFTATMYCFAKKKDPGTYVIFASRYNGIYIVLLFGVFKITPLIVLREAKSCIKTQNNMAGGS